MTQSLTEVIKKEISRADMFEPPEEISGRFDIVERLAGNDHGETYLLTDKATEKRFVLKRYERYKSAGETHEAEILRELQHKGLPGFVAEIDDGGVLYVLREYADGIQLGRYVDEHGPLGEKRAIAVASELCDILTYLHSQPAPVIHRDIKPSNIILEQQDGGVKLIDFGISRRFSKGSDTDTEYFGTRKFSPPEQYGFSQTDSRSDIYALGVVMRYMLTGSADGQVGSKGLSRIIDKCTAFSPGDRYKNAAALKRDLFRYRDNARRSAAKASIAALALCLALAAGFAVGRHTSLFEAQGGKTDLPDDNEPVTFTEPVIEQAVRLMLGKTGGEPLLQGELTGITELYISGTDVYRTSDDYFHWWKLGGSEYGTISRLDDISMLKNIRALYLRGQPISDLSPLTGCLILDALEIDGSPVSESEASKLASLPLLATLRFYNCDIAELSIFSDFRNLRFLGIGNMPIYSISGLDAYQIEYLDISSSHVTSLDGIERFEGLRTLYMDGTRVTDFSPLDRLPALTEISISPNMERYLGTMAHDDIQVEIRE